MSATNDILTGLAGMISTAGIAVIRDPFLPGDTGITFKNLPTDPDRIVCLTAYGASGDQPVITLGSQPVQVRFRGTAEPTDVDTLGDAVFAVLHGATDLTFGSVHVVQILRQSSAPLGMDDQSRRWERTDSYYLDVDLPTSQNRPT